MNLDDNESDDDVEDTNENFEYDDFSFDASKFTFRINKIILFKMSKINPILSSMWQYFLLLCNHQDPEYWSLSLDTSTKSPNSIDRESDLDSSNTSSNNNSLNPGLQQDQESLPAELTNAKLLSSKLRSQNNYITNEMKHLSLQKSTNNKNLILYHKHFKHATLTEQLFKYLSLTIYCDNITTRNQLDNTTGLTMLIINSLVELFELATHESTVLDLFSTIHRNAPASSLFIHSINSNWSNILSKKALSLTLVLEICRGRSLISEWISS